MRNHVRNSPNGRTVQQVLDVGDEPDRGPGHGEWFGPAGPGEGAREMTDAVEDLAADPGELIDEDLGGVVRLRCPDCRQSIAVFVDEDHLPVHALCTSRRNPFGLTVCPGSGRLLADARPTDDERAGLDRDRTVLLTLPPGLDWRTQPFSHLGGPGSQPMRLPGPPLAA